MNTNTTLCLGADSAEQFLKSLIRGLDSLEEAFFEANTASPESDISIELDAIATQTRSLLLRLKPAFTLQNPQHIEGA